MFLGSQTPETARFLDAVAASGARLGTIDEAAPTAPLVILITDERAEDPNPALLAGREVLPVTFTTGFSAVLTERSHLTPRQEGLEAAAQRLARELKLGGATLAGWERLLARVVAWERSRTTSTLLTQNEHTEALKLMARPTAGLDDALAGRARAFVEASGAHIQKRRRRWATVVTTTISMLVVLAIVAGIQAYRASAAANEAVIATNTAEARRLVTGAVGGQGRDPDVPLILASIAGQLSDDADVQSVVAGVVGGEVSHTSVPLESLPQQIVSSSTGEYAYTTYFEPTVRVTDHDGEELGSFQYAAPDEEAGSPRLALGEHGQRVAVQVADTATTVFEATTDGGYGPGFEVGEASDTLISWWDQTTLMVASQAGVDLLDVASGARSTLVEVQDGTGSVTRAALSPNRGMIAITDGESVQVWEADTNRLIGTVNLDRVSALAVDDTGTVVFAAQYPSLTRIDFSDEEPTVAADEQDLASVGIQALDQGYFAASDRRGLVAVYHRDAGTDALTRFRAHLDDVVRIAAAPDGAAFASVSLDGYLRIWDLSELSLMGEYTAAGPIDNSLVAGVLDFDEVYAAAFPKVTFRNQVRLAANGGLVVALPSRGAALVDPADPQVTHDSFGLPAVGLPGRTFIPPSNRHVVRMMYAEQSQTYTAELWRLDDAATTWGAEPVVTHSLDVATGHVGPAPLLVDTDADDTLVVATGTVLSVYLPGDTEPSLNQRHPSPALPLAVAASFDGYTSAVTDDGTLHRLSGDPVDLSALSAELADGRVTAAEFSHGQLWLLASSGAVLVWAGEEEARVVLPPGVVRGLGSLRLSADGARLAHVGPSEVTILDTDDGTMLARQRAPLGVGIDDVSFAANADVLYVVNERGAVAAWDLDGFSPQPPLDPPRALTAEETLTFNVPEVTHG